MQFLHIFAYTMLVSSRPARYTGFPTSAPAHSLNAKDHQVTTPATLLALQSAAPAVVPADTAWMLVATALVLLMTPALAFFYGGLVRSKNSLNTMMMSFAALGAVGITWALLAYSFAFADGNAILGKATYALLSGVGTEARGTIPH